VTTPHPLLPAVQAALGQVIDPELGRPITDLDMVGDIDIDTAGHVAVTLLLTTAVCPLQERLVDEATARLEALDGVTSATVTLGVMTDTQRDALRTRLQGTAREIGFAQPDSPTRVIAIASGKGGVGKSSLTVNLACALAAQGCTVGLLDADIYGHSVPDLLGIDEGDGPMTIEDMGLILPVTAHGVKVISIGMMKPSRDQVVAWRGPVVDRAIGQFLTDVFWADPDFLLIDLPPGTGDTAIGLGQKLPNADVIVVTTPQTAATEVAERAGTMASMMHQRVIGVVENMSYLETTCAHCGTPQRVPVFGTGGGALVADHLTQRLGYEVPLLAEIPLEPQFRVSGDDGTPSVLAEHPGPAAQAIIALAGRLARQ